MVMTTCGGCGGTAVVVVVGSGKVGAVVVGGGKVGAMVVGGGGAVGWKGSVDVVVPECPVFSVEPAVVDVADL
jgi:hypothetical protein